MSHYKRGVVDGVVHYCDNGWWVGKGQRRLSPWCFIDRGNKTAVAAPAPGKRAMVTCFLCLELRRRRP